MPKLILDYATPETNRQSRSPADWRCWAFCTFALSMAAVALPAIHVIDGPWPSPVYLSGFPHGQLFPAAYFAGLLVFSIVLRICGDSNAAPSPAVFIGAGLSGAVLGGSLLGVTWVIARAQYPAGSCVATRCEFANLVFSGLCPVSCALAAWIVARMAR
jgi:hypothetical protein